MHADTITNFENLIKKSNKNLYYDYFKVMDLYKFLNSNTDKFTESDHLTILSFYYELLLGETTDFSGFLNKKEPFIFPDDSRREKAFRLSLEYFSFRNILGFNHSKSIEYILKDVSSYPEVLIKFFIENSRMVEEVFHFNQHLFKDSIETIENKEFYQIYSDSLCDVIVINKNFFETISPSFFSRDGLIIRFCNYGQVGFQKDSIILNEKEALISKGIPLGNYKVFTKDISYVTLHIKKKFFKEFNIELPNYLLKKVAWKLSKDSLKTLNKISTFKNPNIITLKFISEMILILLEENKTLTVESLHDPILISIIEYVNEHLEEHISISFLQKEFGINKNILNNLFKNNFEVSTSKYILNKKLEYSSTLLLETNLSITDISVKLNFSNVSKFSSYFKSKFLLTPLQFKKKFEILSKKG